MPWTHLTWKKKLLLAFLTAVFLVASLIWFFGSTSD